MSASIAVKIEDNQELDVLLEKALKRALRLVSVIHSAEPDDSESIDPHNDSFHLFEMVHAELFKASQIIDVPGSPYWSSELERNLFVVMNYMGMAWHMTGMPEGRLFNRYQCADLGHQLINQLLTQFKNHHQNTN